MDEKAIQFYRKITREGYRYSGTIDNPSIFLDSAGEKIPLCSKSVDSYVHIYISVRNNIIDDVKYRHVGRPLSNVVAEIFCSLLKDKNIHEAENLSEHDFIKSLGADDEEYLEASRNIIRLLRRGLERYKSER